MQRILGIGRTLRVEVVGEHVDHLVVEVDMPDFVLHRFDVDGSEVVRGDLLDPGFDFVGGELERRLESLGVLFERNAGLFDADRSGELVVVFLVGQPDHSVQLLRVLPHFGDRISDKTVAVIGVAGQGGEVHFLFGRGQPDVGFPEDRFDVHAVFGDFIHRNLHGGERNPEFGIFVADGDVVEIEVAQIVIPIDTRRHERSGEEQQGKGSHRDKC